MSNWCQNRKITISKEIRYCKPLILKGLQKNNKNISTHHLLFLSISGVLLSFLPEAVALPLRISAEFSSGAVLLQSLPYAPILIQLLLCVLLSFGGFCVHMQIFSMVEHVPLSYGKFLLFRLLQALFSCLSFYMLQMLFL